MALSMESKAGPQSETARKLVKLFCDYIFWLKNVHRIYQELFEDDDARSLMERTVPAFFSDLNKIVLEYFLLEVAKLTDPPKSGGHENFTVANLIETVNWPPDCRLQIEELSKTVLSFREQIKPARNKLLAHYDKTTVVSSITLGAFPEGEDERLLEALEQMCGVLHKAAFGEIIGDMAPSHPGDVLDLKKELIRAIAFDQLWVDSRGNDRVRLLELLEDVDRGKL